MNANERAGTDHRSRSASRLRNLTRGTTFAAVAATGALTGLAAVSGVGSSTDSAATTALTTISDPASTGSTAPSNATSDSTGSAPATTTPTVTSVAGGAQVSSGEPRFVAAGDGRFGGGFGGRDGSSSVSSWVTSACTPVTVNGASTSVYDCVGATGK